MNNLNAAFGIEQLKSIDSLIDSHRRHAARYDAEINNSKIEKLRPFESGESACWIHSLLVEDRESFQAYLAEHQVASDWVHVRNDQYSIFSEFRTALPNVDSFERRLINIPVGWWLSDQDVDHVIRIVNDY
jgi:dTDP-4-amino-4,6-dideoxygalactose transaminase